MPSRITPRERQIASAVAQGLTNRQIASLLKVQEKTVRNQLTILYQKLSVASRTQLALLLTRQPHLLDLTPSGRKKG